ncbi:MAG: immunoglobulin domain-containing protein [Prevotellaceae bacterium]|nr:immunoglobulin domain-containing protein [Prevotellaceae bacterium]
MKTNAICLLLLLTATGLFAQNGITLSNYKVRAGQSGSPATLTIDIRWRPPADPKKVWNDTVWLFVDYNKSGTMTRLPLAPGATLTNPSWSGAKVIEVAGNPNGVWVVGNARKSVNPQSAFSATVQMVTTCRDTRPCVLTGACVYAINYPPVGRYTAADSIKFTGTPPFTLQLNPSGSTTLSRAQAAGTYKIPDGKTMASFTDASLAPGAFGCKPPVIQTLKASATSYCAGSSVTLALAKTEPGAVYQLYKGGAPVSASATITTLKGSAGTFSGRYTQGSYTVRTLSGAFCPRVASGTLSIVAWALPTVIVTAPPAAFSSTVTLCGNFAQLAAWPSVGASGSSIKDYRWRRDGADIAGAAGPAYTAYSAFIETGGVYTVKVTDSNGCSATSDAVKVVAGSDASGGIGLTAAATCSSTPGHIGGTAGVTCSSAPGQVGITCSSTPGAIGQ